MKTLERHSHWTYQIHLPIVTWIACCLLLHPYAILYSLNSPWLWGSFCLIGLFKKNIAIPQSPEQHAAINTDKKQPLWLIWLITWVMLFALNLAMQATQFFTQGLFAVPPSLTPAGFEQWIFCASIVLLMRLTHDQKDQNFRLQDHLSPWFNDNTSKLCARQSILIISQLSVSWVFIPLVFCAVYFAYQEMHGGQLLQPSMNTLILILPLMHLIAKNRWHHHLRFFIHHGTPLWLLATVSLSLLVAGVLMLQPIANMFFIIDKVLPEHINNIILHSPWPAPLPALSGEAWRWVWWMAWAWPLSSWLHRLYRGKHFIWLLGGLALGQSLYLYLPIDMSAQTATLCALCSAPVLFRLILTRETYCALINAELPIASTSKTRNIGRQLHNNNLSLIFLLVLMLAFGMDWSTWIFLTACIPGLTMIMVALLQALFPRKK